MEETWKDIAGYEGHYQVSNLGNIRSVKKSPFVILKGDFQRNGYKRVYLWIHGGKKNLLVHRLVAEAFIENPNQLSDVNHLDEDKSNNYVSNLQWCSHLYNMNYGNVKSKISHANQGKTASEEVRQKLSVDSSNKRWINDGNKERFVNINRIPTFLSDGWECGRLTRRRSHCNVRTCKPISCR